MAMTLLQVLYRVSQSKNCENHSPLVEVRAQWSLYDSQRSGFLLPPRIRVWYLLGNFFRHLDGALLPTGSSSGYA